MLEQYSIILIHSYPNKPTTIISLRYAEWYNNVQDTSGYASSARLIIIDESVGDCTQLPTNRLSSPEQTYSHMIDEAHFTLGENNFVDNNYDTTLIDVDYGYVYIYESNFTGHPNILVNMVTSDIILIDSAVCDNTHRDHNGCLFCTIDASLTWIRRSVFDANEGSMSDMNDWSINITRSVFSSNIGVIAQLSIVETENVYLNDVVMNNNTANNDIAMWYIFDTTVMNLEDTIMGWFDVAVNDNVRRIFVTQGVDDFTSVNSEWDYPLSSDSSEKWYFGI